MLFLYSLNTLLSGSALLSARDKNLSTWYQVTRSPEKNDQRVNVLGQFQLHLTRCCCVFFLFFCFSSPLCIFQPAESLSSVPLKPALWKGQFTFHRIVCRNARQEGRGQNNGFYGNKAKKTHPVSLPLLSRLRSSKLSDHC